VKVLKLVNPCLGAPLEKREYPAPFYSVTFPFSPSSKQLIAYANSQGHRPIYDYRRSPPTPTFDDDAIGKLISKHPEDPLYPLIATYREIQKVSGTYVGGTAPAADGRVHEDLNHNPSTLRLAMRILQTLPRPDKEDGDGDDTSLYNQVRGLFVAAPNHTLVAVDFSGIEAVTVAYLAGDPSMLRLAGPVAGMHDFVATNAIGEPASLSWSDQDLIDYFSTFKKENRKWRTRSGKEEPYDVIRTASKRGAFASFYGGTPKTLMTKEPELFPTMEIASFYQRLIFDTFPSIQKWQIATCDEAFKLGYITAPGGFRMHFPEGIRKWDCDKATGAWTWVNGPEAEAAMAAKAQHAAFTFSARALKAAYEDDLLRHTLRLSIHDEILTEMHLDTWRDSLIRLVEIMERPNPDMPLDPAWGLGSHLRVGVEAKMSNRWSTMKKVKL
jgi:DNA polymerase I-like protein with 3'-5' exonuclease and polymerase domains